MTTLTVAVYLPYMGTISSLIVKIALLRYNLHPIKFTCFECMSS